MAHAQTNANADAGTAEVNPQALAVEAVAQPDPNLVSTQQYTTTTNPDGTPVAADPLYPPSGPDPAGTTDAGLAEMRRAAGGSPETGAGIEGEQVMWEGRYSMKNFLGRLALRGVLTIAWVVLAVETWANGHENLWLVTTLLGAGLLFFWGILLTRMLLAHYGHFYRLTNRRLFVSTGVVHRRRDQMELLRVKDVYTRQSLADRWLSLGTVVVVSTEQALPITYLTGVNDPKRVMDLVWHHARAERDVRSTNVHPV